MAAVCEKCGAPNRSAKDRFCPEHEAAMRRKMIASGYLQEIPPDTKPRKPAAREKVWETKFGLDP
jgi:hypothetical protein